MTARVQGYYDGLKGLKLEANPFDASDADAFRDWIGGWLDALDV